MWASEEERLSDHPSGIVFVEWGGVRMSRHEPVLTESLPRTDMTRTLFPTAKNIIRVPDYCMGRFADALQLGSIRNMPCVCKIIYPRMNLYLETLAASIVWPRLPFIEVLWIPWFCWVKGNWPSTAHLNFLPVLGPSNHHGCASSLDSDFKTSHCVVLAPLRVSFTRNPPSKRGNTLRCYAKLALESLVYIPQKLFSWEKFNARQVH